MNRRSFLTTTSSVLSAALAARFLDPPLAFASPEKKPAKGKSCIVLWLNGGPSHLDTFDPKPGTQSGGPTKAIKTRARGVEIADCFPHLAERADRLAIVRGMTSKEGNHQRARYLLHTGYAPNPTVIHPSLGGWVSEELAEKDTDLPPFVTIGGPSAGAGFLGVQHGPLFLAKAGVPPQNGALSRNVDETRFALRRAALDEMEARYAAETHDPQVDGRRAVYAQTIRMMRSPKEAAFDLSSESDATKKKYGDTDFGRGCLAARRLVESGVRLVEVTLDGWDTHVDNFEKVRALGTTLDTAMSALLDDLAARKLLASTVVVCLGEFGRTPKINDRDGRDHYPQAWSALLAGGGIRGGIAHGKTDETGSKVVEGKVVVADLFATIVTALGMDPNKSFSTPSGRPIAITEAGAKIDALLA